jgi:ABC-type antimicrobial peptide transport system permease subunit
MLRSYITMAYRSLVRNRLTSLINLSGLIIGLTTGIIIMLFVLFDLRMNHTHQNLKQIHSVMLNMDLGGNIITGRATPGPLGPVLKQQIPSVQYMTRMTQGQSLLRAGDKTLYQTSIYADPDMFRMFTFPALAGDPQVALNDPNSAVLTREAALRLFGTEDALGKSFTVDNKHPLKVGAIVKDIPSSSVINFDIVIPINVFAKDNDWIKKWDNDQFLIWIQLAPGANLELVNKQMTRLYQQHTESKTTAFAYPLQKLYLFNNFKNGKPNGGRIYMMSILLVLGIFVLLIACINFMNLATAMAEGRMKEVGVRKVLGASRKILVWQFLSESLLLTIIATALSVFLAYTVLPFFMAMSGQELKEEFTYPGLWILLGILTLGTGLMAGSYPALYLSRYQPVKVLKKMISTTKGGGLRKVLVTVQFFISIFLIIGVIVAYKQINYVANRPLGYELSNLVDITAEGDLAKHYDLFKQEVSGIKGVENITTATDNPTNFGSSINGMNWPGKTPDQDFNINVTTVGYDWVKTNGLTLLEGRDFSPAYGSDSSGILINEAAVQKMGLKEPIVGIRIDSQMVRGVIKNFVFNDPAAASKPLMVWFDAHGHNHILVRMANDDQWKERLDQIGRIAKDLNPAYPYTFKFVLDDYQKRFENAFLIRKLIALFGGMSIFISCLGLFGMAGFIAERRKKEMSIRKVLGASVTVLWYSLSKEFLKPVIIAFILVVPPSIWASQKFLSTMDYHISLSWWMFALGGMISLVIALVTISYHGMRAARVNPARALQME